MIYRLQRHGEHVSKCSNLDEMPISNGSMQGVISKFKKSESLDVVPASLDLISQRYTHAIQCGHVHNETRGAILLFGVLTFSVAISILIDRMQIQAPDTVFFSLLAPILDAALLFALLLFSLWSFRYECFRPFDEPIIFDRKNRRVFRIFRDVQSGLAGLLKRWPMRAVEWDWSLTEGWHTVNLVTTGTAVSRHHHLRFVVRKSPTDSTIIDSFTLGNSLFMNERNVPVVWEHIRRFMENDGLHLQPQESLNNAKPSQSLWISMGAVGPFGPRFQTWWRRHPAVTISALVMSPVLLPLNLAWGFCHWLSSVTAFPVQLPDEVLQAVASGLDQNPTEPDPVPSSRA